MFVCIRLSLCIAQRGVNGRKAHSACAWERQGLLLVVFGQLLTTPCENENYSGESNPPFQL